MFSPAEEERLRGFPEIDLDELIQSFTLTAQDQAFIQAHRGAGNRLGIAVQLSSLPWLGFVPDDVASAPAPAVVRLSKQLGLAARDLRGYGARGQTRTEHLREVTAFLGWRPAGEREFAELDEFLLARAMEHDSPTLLFRLACEQLRVLAGDPARSGRALAPGGSCP